MIDTKALRQKILDLAFQGKLTEQLPEDGTGEELFQQIQEEKRKLEAEGEIKKSKPLPQIDEAEIPFEIPTNWIWTKVGMISDIAGGTTPKQHEISSVGVVPYFKVSDMNNPGNELEMNHVEWFVNEHYTGQMFPAGTIIFPKNGGAALTNKRRILVTQSVIDLNTAGCSPYGIETTKWIKYFFDTIDFGTFNTGTTIPTVNSGKIKNLLIPLPPYGEIERIIGRIDEAYSIIESIEKLIEKYNRDNLLLKSKLIDAAIQGKLTEQLPEDGTAEELYQQIQQGKRKLEAEGSIKKYKLLPAVKEEEIPFQIPQNWKWVRLGNVTKKVTDGTHHSPPNTDQGDYMYVTAKNIKDNGIIVDNITYVSKEIHDEIFTRCNPELNDVLMIKDGATTGIVTVNNLDFPFSMLSSVALIKPMESVLSWYVVYAMRSSWFYNYVRTEMTGVGITRVVLKQIETFPIPLPPLAEQKRIVSKLEEILPLCE